MKLKPALLSALVLLLVQIPKYSDSHSSGAPASVCSTMIPGHSGSPQSSPSPYSIQISGNEVKGGETLSVTLESTSNVPFKGFFVIGVPKDDTGLNPVGEMVQNIKSPGGHEIFQVNCKSGKGMTHTENTPKNSVTIDWKAPNKEGEYIIMASFVQDYSIWWVKQQSQVIRVTRASGSADTTEVNLGSRSAETEKPKSNFLSPAVEAKLKPFYNGCGSTKGCFGLPQGCITKKNCEMFTSWRVDGTNYRFEIAGRMPEAKTAGHVSMGLSYDEKMGTDSVVGCVLQDNSVQPKSYYNLVGDKQNSGFQNPTIGLLERNGEHLDGWLMCNFSRTPKFETQELGKTFNLVEDKYHFLLARSSLMSTNQVTKFEKLGFHFNVGDKGVTSDAYHLTDNVIAGAKSSILIQLHGSIMIFAWIITASLGIFVARYYKQTHTDFNPFNKAFWFVLHVGSMILTIGLTFLGVILIFIEIGGYSEDINTDAGKAHPILGLVLTGICGLQLTIGLLRPHPGTPKRPIFNWVHWTAGNLGHIIGIACIFLAVELSKSGVQNNNSWLLAMGLFVLFHVLMHGTLSIHTVWADKQMNSTNKLRGLSVGPMKPSKAEEAPGTGIRTFLLLFYFVGILAFAAGLITLIVKANA